MTTMLVFSDRRLDGDYGNARLEARETPGGKYAYPLTVLSDPAFESIHDDLQDGEVVDVTWPVPIDLPDDQI